MIIFLFTASLSLCQFIYCYHIKGNRHSIYTRSGRYRRHFVNITPLFKLVFYLPFFASFSTHTHTHTQRERDGERERERECVCVCVCERERESVFACVHKRAKG